MTDQIHIRDLHLRTIIGISAEERRDRQDVLISITLDADLRAAGRSDDIADAVNYRTLTKRIIALVETSQFYLVEKLAAEIARLCFEDTPRGTCLRERGKTGRAAFCPHGRRHHRTHPGKCPKK